MATLYTTRKVLSPVRVRRVLLTTTAATTVLSWTPPVTGSYAVALYASVVTAATATTLTVSWTDPDTGTSQSLTVANAQSLPVGATPFGTYHIVAQAGSPIAVTATAGTANQVRVSAAVLSLDG